MIPFDLGETPFSHPGAARERFERLFRLIAKNGAFLRAHEPQRIRRGRRIGVIHSLWHGGMVSGHRGRVDIARAPPDDHRMVDKPLPMSVSIVCKNSEHTIGRTLDSVRGLAEEIVAVDSGSTDGTIELLKAHNAVVIESEWLGYKETKQFAMERCSSPWILSLDSDESLEPELAQSIRTAITSESPDVRGYEMNRKVWWAGGPLNYAWQPEWRLRLVRRGEAHWVGRNPHDRLELIDRTARTARISGDMRHDAFTSMEDYLRKNLAHSVVGAQNHFQDGRRGSRRRLLTSPIGAWMKQMAIRQAWRDGWRGWAAASATASATMMKHLILLELSRRDSEEARTHRDG